MATLNARPGSSRKWTPRYRACSTSDPTRSPSPATTRRRRSSRATPGTGCPSYSNPPTPSRLPRASGSVRARAARSASSPRRRSWASSWDTPSSSTATALKIGQATQSERLAALEREIVSCRRCPRLVEWREKVAREKRAAYADEAYWGRPVPGFGDPAARVVVIGLAPAAHGGNRTGRIFTGDRSGDFLFPVLHETGFANQPTSIAAGDGLALRDMYVCAVNRCAPPDNRPTPEERDNCL